MPTTDHKKKRNPIRRILSLLRHINFNIGTFIFGALFLYMAISFVLYLTAGHVTSYQVVSGPLEKNQTYTALALREEQIFTTDTSGYVNYYARENARIKKNGLIYTIGEEQTKEETIQLTDNALAKIRSSMAKFATNFTSDNFNTTYGFKYELESNILQYSGMNEASLENENNFTISGNQTAVNSPTEGIVLYSIDGFENKQAENITSSDFNQRTYHRETLKTNKKLDAGSNVFKLVPNEEWSLIVPLTNEQMAQLAAKTSIKVKFLKDGSSQVGKFSILFQNDEKFGKIDFDSGLMRYVTDRYIDIELVTNTKSGLKVPVSSIIQKELFTIPESFLNNGGNLNEAGFLRERTDKNGKVKKEFITTTLYLKKDGLCYVDTTDFQRGDRILMNDSNEQYIVKDKETLEGVYSINKGYTVFRQVIIIDQDDEYCIVEKGQDYSIAQFDHIVLNGNTVKDKDILY